MHSNYRITRNKGALKQSKPTDIDEFPAVSIITAVFNGQDNIASCIQSVLKQEYPNIEHIIVDGGSTDGTVEVLRHYNGQVAAWISEPDTGVYDAWNKGLKLASGDWIAFLGADDIYLPGAVNEYMKLARTVPDAEFLSSRIEWIHPTGYRRIMGEPWAWPRFRRFMCTAHPGSMHARSLFERYGDYNITYRIAADYEFLLRAGSRLCTGFSPTITVKMQAGGVSDSSAALREARRAKIETGNRSSRLGEIEYRIAFAKLFLRRGLMRLRRSSR
jgi:glycosyltransferase involved in cell wall biosynthesis